MPLVEDDRCDNKKLPLVGLPAPCRLQGRACHQLLNVTGPTRPRAGSPAASRRNSSFSCEESGPLRSAWERCSRLMGSARVFARRGRRKRAICVLMLGVSSGQSPQPIKALPREKFFVCTNGLFSSLKCTC